MDAVKISDFSYKENSYTRNNLSYRVVDLIEAAKSLKTFNLPLQGIDLSIYPWGRACINNFVYEMKRVQNADLSFPIILDNEGFICDGWHRVAKAILEGRKIIKAKRLEVMPEPVNNKE